MCKKTGLVIGIQYEMNNFLFLDAYTTDADMLVVLTEFYSFFKSTKIYFFLKKALWFFYRFWLHVYYFWLAMVLVNTYVLYSSKTSIYLYTPKNDSEVGQYVECFVTVIHNTSFLLLYFFYSDSKLLKLFKFIIRSLIINFLGLNLIILYVFICSIKLKNSNNIYSFFIKYFCNSSDSRKLILVSGRWVANPMFRLKTARGSFFDSFLDICKENGFVVDTIKYPTIKDDIFNFYKEICAIKKHKLLSFRAHKIDEPDIRVHRFLPGISGNKDEFGMITDSKRSIKNNHYQKDFIVSETSTGDCFSKPSSILIVEKASLNVVPGSEKVENVIDFLESFDLKSVNDLKLSDDFFTFKKNYDDAACRLKSVLSDELGSDRFDKIIKEFVVFTTDGAYSDQFSLDFQDN